MIHEQQIRPYDPNQENIVNQDFIEKSVQFINDKANETLYKGSLEIGNYILKHFFNDDIALASSKNPKKPRSYRLLCHHKDLSVPYSTLTIMVRVAAQEKFFKLNQIDTSKIGYTHKANLIRLQNDETKLILAKRCMEEPLSTRKLAEIVQQTRERMIEDGDNDQEETAFQNIAKIEQWIGKSEKSGLVTDINKIRPMKAKTREDLHAKATELLSIITRTSKDCRKLLRNLQKVKREKSA